MPPSSDQRSTPRSLLFTVTAVYTILLIIRPQEFIPSLANMPLLQFILLGAVGIWAFTPDKGLELPQFTVLPFFLVCVWLSLGFAGWWGGIVPALNTMLPPILYCVAISGCVRSIEAFRKFTLLLVLCAAVLVLHGHFQSTQGISWTGQPMIEGRITYSGIFNDPNDMGLLFAMSVAFCVYHLRISRRKMARWLALATLGWLLYGVYLTDSRGTMLAILAVLGLEVGYSYGKKIVIVAASIAVPVLVAFTRLAEVDSEEASAQGRVDAWYEGVQLLMAHPVFGAGWGMFSDYNFGLTAHNSVVLAMAELGLAGFTFWLALVGLSGWMIFRMAFPGKGSAAETQSVWSAAPLVAATALPATPAVAGGPPPVAVPAVASYRYDPAAARVGARPTTADSISAMETEERLTARSLMVAVSGFAVGAFFLSQSYKAMLFVCCGLVAGRYLGMRAAGVAVPAYITGLIGKLPLLFVAAIGTVIFMWILVKILL